MFQNLKGGVFNMKKLILIGNKIIDKNISNIIDNEFDYVVRVNRMNNYGITGTKTDLLVSDPHKIFFKLVKEPYDKFLNAKQLIMNLNSAKTKNKCMLFEKNIFSLNQLINKINISFKEYHKKIVDTYLNDQNISYVKFTTFFLILCYLIETYSNEYEIWFTCIDVNGRGEMFKTNDIWKRSHAEAGVFEEYLLNKFINDGIVKQLLI